MDLNETHLIESRTQRDREMAVVGDEDDKSKPVAFLEVLENKHVNKTVYSLFTGKNVIGRDRASTVCIKSQTLSKQHAVISIEKGGGFCIYDVGSLNKTKKSSCVLKPGIPYDLQNEEIIIFADIECRFSLPENKVINTDSEDSSDSLYKEMAAAPMVKRNSEEDLASEDAHSNNIAFDVDLHSNGIDPLTCSTQRQVVDDSLQEDQSSEEENYECDRVVVAETPAAIIRHKENSDMHSVDNTYPFGSMDKGGGDEKLSDDQNLDEHSDESNDSAVEDENMFDNEEENVEENVEDEASNDCEEELEKATDDQIVHDEDMNINEDNYESEEENNDYSVPVKENEFVKIDATAPAVMELLNQPLDTEEKNDDDYHAEEKNDDDYHAEEKTEEYLCQEKTEEYLCQEKTEEYLCQEKKEDENEHVEENRSRVNENEDEDECSDDELIKNLVESSQVLKSKETIFEVLNDRETSATRDVANDMEAETSFDVVNDKNNICDVGNDKEDETLKALKEIEIASFRILEDEDRETLTSLKDEERDTSTPLKDEEKETSFNENFEEKEISFNENLEEKETLFNENLEEKETSFDEKHEEKETSFDANHEEMETSLNENHEEMEISLNESHEEIETSLNENHEEIETSLNENHEEIETSLNENREEMETNLNENHQEMETSLNEKHDENETSLNEKHEEEEIPAIENHEEKEKLSNLKDENKNSEENSELNNEVNDVSSILNEKDQTDCLVIKEDKEETSCAEIELEKINFEMKTEDDDNNDEDMEFIVDEKLVRMKAIVELQDCIASGLYNISNGIVQLEEKRKSRKGRRPSLNSNKNKKRSLSKDDENNSDASSTNTAVKKTKITSTIQSTVDDDTRNSSGSVKTKEIAKTKNSSVKRKLESEYIENDENKDEQAVETIKVERPKVGRPRKIKRNNNNVNEADTAQTKNESEIKSPMHIVERNSMKNKKTVVPVESKKKNKKTHISTNVITNSTCGSSTSNSRKSSVRRKQIKKSSNTETFSSPSEEGEEEEEVGVEDYDEDDGRVRNPKIMFTGMSDQKIANMIRSLGGSIVESIDDCTHLISDKIRRTVKLLCTLSRGHPVVTVEWIYASQRKGYFIDPWPYLVQDRHMEQLYKFSLARSLKKASSTPLFSNCGIHVTESVLPGPEDMKKIIASAGGQFLNKLPATESKKMKVLIISCPEDLPICSKAIKNKVKIVDKELILTGILRQEFAIDDYLLTTL